MWGEKWLIYWKEGRRTKQRNGTDTQRGCRLGTEGKGGGDGKQEEGGAETRATEERLMEMSDRLSEWFTTGGAAAEPALDGWSWKTETNHKSCLWIIDRDKGGGEKAMALTFILPIMYIDELHYGALIKKWAGVLSPSSHPAPPSPLISSAISVVIKDAASPAHVPQLASSSSQQQPD